MAVLQVRLFAVLRDRFGADSIEIEIDPGLTARGLLDSLIARFPDQARQLATCRVAVNHRFANAGDAVSTGDEVALIPPVSGG